MAIVHQITLFLCVTAAINNMVEAANVFVGVCHGTDANNLPHPAEVNQMYRKYRIHRARFYEFDEKVIGSFQGMGIDISFSLTNSDLLKLSASQDAVNQWFDNNLKRYITDFVINYIVVGDKAIPGLHDVILPVMKFLRNTLNAHNLGQVKITTVLGYGNALTTPDPPSRAEFEPNTRSYVLEILKFLSSINSPLMVSLFPHRKMSTAGNISLSYATFQSSKVVVRDGKYKYYNLFDAMVDGFYAAMFRLGIDIDVVVAETGWPTCGNSWYTPAVASIYNRNFLKHIQSGKGTPMKPNVFMEGYIRSMFNENLKSLGESRCFGIFKVNKQPVYPLF